MLLEQGYTAATAVAAIAVFGPSQVAARVLIWLFARKRSIRALGMINVLLFPLGVSLLAMGSLGFAAVALFVYGAANGVMTIVRGLAVPEMLTREAYGAINGVLAIPVTIMRALAPLGAAFLWSWGGSYDAVLVAAIFTSGLFAAAFWFAALESARGT
jgi:hypothetical protein